MQKLAVSVILALFLALGAGTVALADHLGNGLAVFGVLIANDSGTDQANAQVPFLLSSQQMVEGFYFDADGLNTDVREGSTHRAYMPGTGQVQVLACFDNAGGDDTVACNSATADDVTLPVTGAEVIEFALDNQARHLWVNTSTPAVADWTVVWEYWNGSSYVSLANVTDRTEGFTLGETRKVSWDFPAEGLWPESTLHSIPGYWIQARVSAATTITTPPVGEQVWYETGRWWAVQPSIGTGEQLQLSAHLDVDNDKTFHYYIPRSDGVTLGDAAALEPAANFDLVISGYIDATAPVSGSEKKLVFKDSALECEVTAEGVITCSLYE